MTVTVLFANTSDNSSVRYSNMISPASFLCLCGNQDYFLLENGQRSFPKITGEGVLGNTNYQFSLTCSRIF